MNDISPRTDIKNHKDYVGTKILADQNLKAILKHIVKKLIKWVSIRKKARFLSLANCFNYYNLPIETNGNNKTF